MVALRKLGATAAVLAAVANCSAPLQAQERLSLSERVARLEQQANPQGGAVTLVNRIQDLQAQVQTLQGQVEELQHALDEARQRNKEQYIDLDSRLARLEGRAPAPAAAGGAGTTTTPQPPDVDLGGPGGATAPAAPASAPTAAPDTLTDADRAAGGTPAAAADPAAESSTYNEAFGALKEGRYAESARRFQGFIDQYPNSELAGNAWYWLGESYYATQNYPIALEAFQTLLTRYPGSQKAPDALLKVGYSQYELKQFAAARDTLDQVVQRYPDSTVARLAQGRLRALATDAAR